MWRYGHFPHFSWMGSFFPGDIFSMFVWVLFILVLVYLVTKLFGSLKSEEIKWSRDSFDSFEILKMRYARGKISHDEYVRMKETLEQSY